MFVESELYVFRGGAEFLECCLPAREAVFSCSLWGILAGLKLGIRVSGHRIRVLRNSGDALLGRGAAEGSAHSRRRCQVAGRPNASRFACAASRNML